MSSPDREIVRKPIDPGRSELYTIADLHYEELNLPVGTTAVDSVFAIRNSRHTLLDVFARNGSSEVSITAYGTPRRMFNPMTDRLVPPPRDGRDPHGQTEFVMNWLELPNGSASVAENTHFTETLTDPYYFMLIRAVCATGTANVDIVLHSVVG